MELNLTNLKDLDFICSMANESASRIGGPHWVERIQRYRRLIQEEIAKLELESPPETVKKS